MSKFELNRLTSHDDADILAEVRRVAGLVSTTSLSVKQFDSLSRVHSSTLRKRFGSWRNALHAAGLDHLVNQSNRARSAEEIVSELRRVAAKLHTSELIKTDFYIHGKFKCHAVLAQFGSWKKALVAAGLRQTKRGIRYTDEECYENLLSVWTKLGRPPKHDEMNMPPSKVGSKAYVLRWGSWLRALEAFVERANSGDRTTLSDDVESNPASAIDDRPSRERSGPRDAPLGLRYRVLVRDRFRCVLCGRSPATNQHVNLHVDHILPWSKGGVTEFENLRTLCKDCNIGKADQIEPPR